MKGYRRTFFSRVFFFFFDSRDTRRAIDIGFIFSVSAGGFVREISRCGTALRDVRRDYVHFALPPLRDTRRTGSRRSTRGTTDTTIRRYIVFPSGIPVEITVRQGGFLGRHAERGEGGEAAKISPLITRKIHWDAARGGAFRTSSERAYMRVSGVRASRVARV